MLKYITQYDIIYAGNTHLICLFPTGVYNSYVRMSDSVVSLRSFIMVAKLYVLSIYQRYLQWE